MYREWEGGMFSFAHDLCILHVLLLVNIRSMNRESTENSCLLYGSSDRCFFWLLGSNVAWFWSTFSWALQTVGIVQVQILNTFGTIQFEKWVDPPPICLTILTTSRWQSLLNMWTKARSWSCELQILALRLHNFHISTFLLIGRRFMYFMYMYIGILCICILQCYSIHILHIWYMFIASLYWGVCFHLFLSLYAITHAWSNTTLCSSCRSILKASYMYLHPIFFHHHILLEIPCYIRITKDVGFRTCPRFSCHSERIQTERNKFRHFRLSLLLGVTWHSSLFRWDRKGLAK